MAHFIALHLPSFEQRTSVLASLRRGSSRVSVCSSEDAVFHAFAGECTPDVLLTGLRDATGQSAVPFLSRLRTAFPGAMVVAYGALSPQFARDLLDAARHGVAEVAIHGYDNVPALLMRIANKAAGQRVADLALAAVDERLSRLTRPVIGYCLASAHAPPSVAQIASVFRVNRKTVAAWLRAEKLPPASTVVGWGRVLLAARYLEDAGRPVERIAFALGFDSGSALRHMVSRYTRLRTAEIRARGGFAGVLPLFTDALVPRSGPRPAPGCSSPPAPR